MDATIERLKCSISERIERIARDMHEHDIDIKSEELIIRNAEELFLMREFRVNKLQRMKDDAACSLKPLKGTTN
jgi:hypothetical protein